MTKLLLTPENQIQRLNHFLNYVEDVKRESYDVLSFRPNSTSWNVLEVLEHLRISHSLYKSNIDIVLNELTQNSEVPWQYRPSLWTRLVLKGQRPKGNKRPFKIKTLKRFEPLLNENVTHDTSNRVFDGFFEAHHQLKQAIIDSRTKIIAHKKIPSAIGPIVKFHLPEAFEFLICHAERHKVQMDEIVASYH